MRAGREAERKPVSARPPAGSWPARHRRRDPHPRRAQPALPEQLRLGFPHRAAGAGGGQDGVLAARPGDRRLVVNQRDDLHPRQQARLQHLARRVRLRRLGLQRHASVLHQGGAELPRLIGLPRRIGPAVGHRPEVQVGVDHGVRRVGRERGGTGQPGLQRPEPGRRRLLPAHAEGRQALVGGRRLPAPRRGPAEPDRADRRAGHVRRDRGRPCGRCQVQPHAAPSTWPPPRPRSSCPAAR